MSFFEHYTKDDHQFTVTPLSGFEFITNRHVKENKFFLFLDEFPPHDISNRKNEIVFLRNLCGVFNVLCTISGTNSKATNMLKTDLGDSGGEKYPWCRIYHIMPPPLLKVIKIPKKILLGFQAERERKFMEYHVHQRAQKRAGVARLVESYVSSASEIMIVPFFRFHSSKLQIRKPQIFEQHGQYCSLLSSTNNSSLVAFKGRNEIYENAPSFFLHV